MKQQDAVQRPFAVFDIDGTLIRWQLYHAVTDALAKLGYLEPELYAQIKTARIAWKMRTDQNAFKTYEAVMIRAFEQLIKHLTVTQFEHAVDTVIEQYKDQVYTFSRDLIKELKAKNYLLFAISGSQIELVRRIAAYYEFDDFIGTDYVKMGGLFTGDKNFYANDKKKAIEQLIVKHRPILNGSMAIGDSTSDISMLEIAEHAIAFNPEYKLFTHAKSKGWQVVLERKNVIYRLEMHDGQYILA